MNDSKTFDKHEHLALQRSQGCVLMEDVDSSPSKHENNQKRDPNRAKFQSEVLAQNHRSEIMQCIF